MFPTGRAKFLLGIFPTGPLADNLKDYISSSASITGNTCAQTTPFISLTDIFEEESSKLDIYVSAVETALGHANSQDLPEPKVKRLELMVTEDNISVGMHSEWVLAFLDSLKEQLGEHHLTRWAPSKLTKSEGPVNQNLQEFPTVNKLWMPLSDNLSPNKFELVRTLALEQINLKLSTEWEIRLYQQPERAIVAEVVANSTDAAVCTTDSFEVLSKKTEVDLAMWTLHARWPFSGKKEEETDIPNGREASSCFNLLITEKKNRF